MSGARSVAARGAPELGEEAICAAWHIADGDGTSKASYNFLMSGEIAALGAGMSVLVGSQPHPTMDEAIRAQVHAGIDLLTMPELILTGAQEGLLARGLLPLPEVNVDSLGNIELDVERMQEPLPSPSEWISENERIFLSHPLVAQSHGVKVQTVGPLTGATALIRAGMDPAQARTRAMQAGRARVSALSEALHRANPMGVRMVMVDEPVLATNIRDAAQIEVDADLISGVLQAAERTTQTGIHCCGNVGLDTAFAAGCDVLCVVPTPDIFDHLAAIIRHTEADGYFAWGAVSTNGPVPEHADHSWESLVRVWCELSNRGVDPLLLRTQALLSPECGLGLHSASAAERVMEIVSELRGRVRDQVVATRLSLGA